MTAMANLQVSSLDHEVGNNSVEDGALVMKRLAGLSNSLFSSAL
jgi:hypothetical protein